MSAQVYQARILHVLTTHRKKTERVILRRKREKKEGTRGHTEDPPSRAMSVDVHCIHVRYIRAQPSTRRRTLHVSFQSGWTKTWNGQRPKARFSPP